MVFKWVTEPTIKICSSSSRASRFGIRNVSQTRGEGGGGKGRPGVDSVCAANGPNKMCETAGSGVRLMKAFPGSRRVDVAGSGTA